VESRLYRVIEVVDGDSLILEDGSKVRLIGINAPEKGYPFYNKAKLHLSSLILGKEVRLESDYPDKDRYGRLLRYVFVRELFVNVQLVKDGMANIYMETGLKYIDQLREAEDYAKLHSLGIWKEATIYTDHIYLVELHYNAEGNDDENLNDEYLILGNQGDELIDLTGWTIQDEGNHLFTFPHFILEPEQTVIVYTGSGTNTKDSLYWRSQGAIWNNKKDILFLRNAEGELIFSYEYQ
jgi:micrococcal nuclease